MIRKAFFWLHFSAGITAGVFIFIMAATGVVLSFERQMTEWVDRDVRFVSIPNDVQRLPLKQQFEVVQRAGIGDPTAIVLRNQRETATQFAIGRSKTTYVDPYGSAVIGFSSARAHAFFFGVERLHRSLGAPLGSKTVGHWLTAVSNLLFGALILLGVVLWLPRQWSWKTVRATIAFRTGLRGRAREWNWHNVIGIWCAVPLLVIVLTGVVMSFDWANVLLFRLAGSPLPAARSGESGESHSRRELISGNEPNYEYLFMRAQNLKPNWRTITLNVAHDAKGPVTAVVDTGSGGQPQARTQYLLDRETGAVVRTTTFADNSLGQRLRAFVRFGHTGEYGGWPGQALAALASLGACVLVYTGLSLAIRRLAAKLKRKNGTVVNESDADAAVRTEDPGLAIEKDHTQLPVR